MAFKLLWQWCFTGDYNGFLKHAERHCLGEIIHWVLTHGHLCLSMCLCVYLWYVCVACVTCLKAMTIKAKYTSIKNYI